MDADMEWFPILVAVLIAIIVAMPLVGVLGWRRPGAPEAEPALVSAAFFFVILFLATWAAGMWLVPWGPVAWGVAWLGWLAVALIVTLILGAASQQEHRRRRRNAEPTPATQGELAAVGFGVAFWTLLVVLLMIALSGSARAE